MGKTGGTIMNCKEAEKHIYLYKSDELTHAEAAELKMHVDECEHCKKLYTELETYKKLILELENIQTESINAEAFTDDIINLIEKDKSRTLKTKSPLRVIQLPLFRAASIAIILLSSTTFFFQNRMVNQSLAELEMKFEKKKANSEFLDNYMQCVDYSQFQIAQLVENDIELLEVLENSSKGFYPKDIERYAAKICQQPIDVNHMNIEEKKKLLFRLIREKNNL